MSKESWQCPYCTQHATITEHDRTIHECYLHSDTKYGNVGVQISSRRCPNPACKEFDLTVTVNPGVGAYRNWCPKEKEVIMQCYLRPDSIAKPQPDYIPMAIRQDYEEACKILDLSPKASATLSRRCLQGMIRDFWSSKVQDLKKDTLWHEIEAIKDDVDPETWDVLKATKDVGNIGAHMQKDVNLIIDVTSQEATQLIETIEYLFKDWYILRHTRAEHRKRLQKTADLKKQQIDTAKNSGTLAEQDQIA